MKLLSYLSILIGCLLVTLSVFSQSEKKFIREGNKQYQSKNFPSSEEAYQKALNIDSHSYSAAFNLGDAFYKLKKYDEAENKFANLSQSVNDKTELSRVYHNLGNSQLYQSKKLMEGQKMEDGMKKVQESINSYKNALRNNPTDLETKHNLYYAQQLLKQMQQQKQQNKDKKDQEKKDKDKEDKKENQDKKENEKKDQKEQQQKQQISKQDAERMLEAIKNDEKKTQDKLKKEQMVVKKVKKEKDW
jgi:Ca-activated chloride channel homolog